MYRIICRCSHTNKCITPLYLFLIHEPNSWSKIAAQLPGRTANCVKNKWHGSKKARRAGLIGGTAANEPAAKKMKPADDNMKDKERMI